MRQANRRLRLLVAVFAVVFAAASVRVAWLQAVKAQTLDHLASSQQREALDVPARRGTIFDRNGVQLAFGERATTVYANPKQIVDPRDAAIAVGEALGPRRRQALSAAHRPLARLRLPRPQGRSREGRGARSAEDCGHRLPARGAPRLPAACARLGGRRLRGHREPGPRRASSCSSTTQLAGVGRLEDDRPRPVRAHDRRARAEQVRGRQGRLPDDRRHAPGPRRARSAPSARRAGRRSRRRRSSSTPADGRHSRARRRARLRRQRLSGRWRAGTRRIFGTAPSPTRTSRARRSRS